MNYAFPYEQKQQQQEIDEAETLAMQTFFYKIERKIIKEKCAYILKDLLEDLISICEEMNVETVISNNRTLRRRLEKEYGTAIAFDVHGSTWSMPLIPSLVTML